MPNQQKGLRTSPVRGRKQPVKQPSKAGQVKRVLTPTKPGASVDTAGRRQLKPASYYIVKLAVDGRHFYTGKGDRVKPPNKRFKRGLLDKHIKAKEAVVKAKEELAKYNADQDQYYLWQDKILKLEGEVEATLQPRGDILFNGKGSSAKVYEQEVAEWFASREVRRREKVDGNMVLRKDRIYKFNVIEYHN